MTESANGVIFRDTSKKLRWSTVLRQLLRWQSALRKKLFLVTVRRVVGISTTLF